MAARCDASAVDRDSAGQSVCFRAAADRGSRLEGLDIKGAAVDRDTFAAAAARFAFVAAADTGAGTKSRLDSIIAGIKNGLAFFYISPEPAKETACLISDIVSVIISLTDAMPTEIRSSKQTHFGTKHPFFFPP